MKFPKKISSTALALFFIVSGLQLAAQQTFRYGAALQKVDSDGFYRISLSPEIVAKSKAGLADLRIMDDRQRFMPFMFGNQLILKDQASFILFPQLQHTTSADSVTTFIAENSLHLTVNHLYLKLRNTAVERIVNLSGSDDLEHWYAIKENISLADADAGLHDKGTYMQLLNFPSSTYQYLKIQVVNKNKEPVAILQAGIYQQQAVQPVYLKIKDGTIRQKDTAAMSLVSLQLNENYQVNKLHLTIEGQKYYKRSVRIYELAGNIRQLVSDTLINSSAPADLYLSVKTNKIILEIINGDNPPLVISKIEAYQLDQSLISYFEKGKAYSLLFGDERATIPDYDLKFFGDSVQHQLISIQHAAVQKNALYQVKKEHRKEKSSKWNEWLLGGAVVVAIALLALLTFKMVTEVNKRNEQNNS